MRDFLLILCIAALSSVAAAASNVTTLTAQRFPEYKSARVEITYGPFLAPSSNENMGMADFLRGNVTKPCSDCLITFMQAGLQYTDGSYANADTGMWLHHVVLYNENATDAVCQNKFPVQRTFASGNERSPLDFTINGTVKAGYYVGSTDQLGLLTELMNEMTDPREAVLTMTFEYIPGMPKDFATVTPIWLDVTGCGNSEVAAYANTTFNYSSPAWTSDVSGEILITGGHIHDGGVHIEIMQNGKAICDSVASYGLSPGYIEGNSSMMSSMSMGMSMSTSESMSMSMSTSESMSMSMSMSESMSMSMSMSMPMSSGMAKRSMSMDMPPMSMSEPSMTMSMPSSPSPTDITGMEMGMDTIHISNMSFCSGLGQLNKGDTLMVQAFYNTSEYAPMMGPNNTLEPVMGIALMYVANGVASSPTGSTAPTGTSTGSSTGSTGGAAVNAKAGLAAAIAAPFIPLVLGF